MRILVMTHPVNTKVFEVLFNIQGNKFTTVDKLTIEDLQLVGYEPKVIKNLDRIATYRIIGKALAEKIFMTAFDSDEKRIRNLKSLAEKLVQLESKYDEDYDLPEVVISLVNCRI